MRSTGTLVYIEGTVEGTTRLEFIDRTGRKTGSSVASSAGSQGRVRFSPDGQRFAVVQQDDRTGNNTIWLEEPSRNVRTPFTLPPSNSRDPVWSPDGNRIAFASEHNGHFDLYAKPVNLIGKEELLLEDSSNKWPADWSKDGRYLLYERLSEQSSNFGLWVLPLFGDRKPFPLVDDQFNNTYGRFSPDGHWLAYNSDRAGASQVFVTSFPDRSREWQVSTERGGSPLWSRDGRHLLYVSEPIAGTLFQVDVSRANGSLQFSSPRPLFKMSVIGMVAGGRNRFDLTPDGKLFLVVSPDLTEIRSEPLRIVTNWPEHLKK